MSLISLHRVWCVRPIRLLVVAMVCLTVPARAQQFDSVQIGVRQPLAPVRPAASSRPPGSAPDSLLPPVSPRRAFLYSLLLPGAGQARLDRRYAGGMFFLIEVGALTYLHRSAEDLRIARAWRGDSIPLRYDLNAVTGLPLRDATGNLVVSEWRPAPFDHAWVRTRKLHYEDWFAVLVFNHLFSGADAFVAAQLWDLPGRIALRPTPVGAMMVVSIPSRGF